MIGVRILALAVACLFGVIAVMQANDDVNTLAENLSDSIQRLAAEQTELQARRDDAERRLVDNREQLAAQSGALAALRQVQTVLATTPTAAPPPPPTSRPTP